MENLTYFDLKNNPEYYKKLSPKEIAEDIHNALAYYGDGKVNKERYAQLYNEAMSKRKELGIGIDDGVEYQDIDMSTPISREQTKSEKAAEIAGGILGTPGDAYNLASLFPYINQKSAEKDAFEKGIGAPRALASAIGQSIPMNLLGGAISDDKSGNQFVDYWSNKENILNKYAGIQPSPESIAGVEFIGRNLSAIDPIVPSQKGFKTLGGTAIGGISSIPQPILNIIKNANETSLGNKNILPSIASAIGSGTKKEMSRIASSAKSNLENIKSSFKNIPSEIKGYPEEIQKAFGITPKSVLEAEKQAYGDKLLKTYEGGQKKLQEFREMPEKRLALPMPSDITPSRTKNVIRMGYVPGMHKDVSAIKSDIPSIAQKYIYPTKSSSITTRGLPTKEEIINPATRQKQMPDFADISTHGIPTKQEVIDASRGKNVSFAQSKPSEQALKSIDDSWSAISEEPGKIYKGSQSAATRTPAKVEVIESKNPSADAVKNFEAQKQIDLKQKPVSAAGLFEAAKSTGGKIGAQESEASLKKSTMPKRAMNVIKKEKKDSSSIGFRPKTKKSDSSIKYYQTESELSKKAKEDFKDTSESVYKVPDSAYEEMSKLSKANKDKEYHIEIQQDSKGNDIGYKIVESPNPNAVSETPFVRSEQDKEELAALEDAYSGGVFEKLDKALKEQRRKEMYKNMSRVERALFKKADKYAKQ